MEMIFYEKSSVHDNDGLTHCHRHPYPYRNATKIGDPTCFIYTRKQRCNLYCDVYQSVYGHLRRPVILLWILYFRGISARYRIPRAFAYSLCDTWSLFPTKISKDARKSQNVMDFQLRPRAHSRSRRSTSLRPLLLRFRDGSSKHVLRPLRPSRIWYSDSQYGRL